MYWSHLVLSTITQTQGTSKGSLFDTSDMTPLTGEAAAEMLRILEESAKYGTDNEFTEAINLVQNERMNAGECVMTFMWGDLCRRSNAQGSVLHDKLGIAPREVIERLASSKGVHEKRANMQSIMRTWALLIRHLMRQTEGGVPQCRQTRLLKSKRPWLTSFSGPRAKSKRSSTSFQTRHCRGT